MSEQREKHSHRPRWATGGAFSWANWLVSEPRHRPMVTRFTAPLCHTRLTYRACPGALGSGNPLSNIIRMFGRAKPNRGQCLSLRNSRPWQTRATLRGAGVGRWRHRSSPAEISWLRWPGRLRGLCRRAVGQLRARPLRLVEIGGRFRRGRRRLVPFAHCALFGDGGQQPSRAESARPGEWERKNDSNSIG